MIKISHIQTMPPKKTLVMLLEMVIIIVIVRGSIRVSNELGAGRPQAARLATRVVILLAISLGVCEGLFMVLARNLLGYAYSNEKEVALYTAKLTPILAVCTLFDSLQCVLSGM